MSKEAKLGLFVLVVFVVFLLFTINMGTWFFQRGERSYKLYFTNIGTLEKGAPVKQAGFDVGEVRNISKTTILEPTPITHIVVEVRVTNEAQICVDSKASIQTLGMMGEKYIEITFGSGEFATKDTLIEGQGPYELDRVIEKAVLLTDDVRVTVQAFNKLIGDSTLQNDIKQLTGNFEKFSEELNKIMGGEQQNVQTTIANLSAASANLKSMIATSEWFITDAHQLLNRNEGNITKTIDNTAAITQDLRESLSQNLKDISVQLKEFSGKLNTFLTRGDQILYKLDGILDENQPDIRKTFANLSETSERASSISNRMDEMMKYVQEQEGLIHTLIYDKDMALAAKATVQETSGIVQEFSHFSDRFSFIAEFQYYTDSKFLDPDQNHWRADLGVQFAFNRDLYLYVGGNYLGSVNLWEAQLGYHWGPLTLHGGAIESEIGAGLDWQIMNRWMVGIEGVNLTKKDEERLDAYTEIRLWNQIYLVGGVQDVMDDVYPHFGVKVRF